MGQVVLNDTGTDEKAPETDNFIEEAIERYYASDIQYEMDLDTYIEKYVYEKD